MVDRIWLQGDPLRFRVTKPGKDVTSGDMNDFVLHEEMDVCAPFVSGSVTFAGGGSILVSLGHTFSHPPLIILKRADNRPITPTGPLFARMQSDGASMRIHNYSEYTAYPVYVGAVTYYVYSRTLG